MSDQAVLDQIVRKLSARGDLDDGDRAAIHALPYVRRAYEAPAYVLREGEPAKKVCNFVVSGLAYRQKLTSEGARQIVSIHMAGDFLDLQHLFLTYADHSVQALTRLDVAEIDRDALHELVLQRPAVGRAMWTDALVDASIFREWVLNIGRRDARARVAHLLCEFALRMEAAGIAEHHRYELPMTQEQIGDAVGLTPVHVNRTLRALAADGLIRRERRHISLENWEEIRQVADFSALYLHLDPASPAGG
ncbi:Crp/Fnr family transcriptional regulator [Sphingomonas oligophenolica]|uniref:Crp/Fnr family transcriptional regulator n=1 Tax=Sphingomonas oligophenolica TaxID=301154 RepID=A0ABU9Y0J2_9SPHN